MSDRSSVPSDFMSFWELRRDAARAGVQVSLSPAPVQSPFATYQQMQVSTPGSEPVHARYIRPATDDPVPLVIAFPDFHQGVRGWHHLTRFVALGQAVVALDARTMGLESLDVTSGCQSAPEGLDIANVYTAALRLVAGACSLDGIDHGHISLWGEGLGAGMAFVACALMGDESWRCACCNPLPAGIDLARDGVVTAGPLAGISRRFRMFDATRDSVDELAHALDYIDLTSFAPLITGHLLVGTGLLDEVSSPWGQRLLVETCDHVASCRQLTYRRHAHERINEFENELIVFLA